VTSPLLLLCTDLDRTLLPNGRQPESPHARQRFKALAARMQIVLTFVTGRDRGLVERAITNYQLPWPDFVISDVGTNIYDLRKGEWQVWPEWQKEIAPDWNGRSHGQLRQLLQGFKHLRLQEHAKQNTFKLSYYLPLQADWDELHGQIEKRLRENGIDASLIWSVDEPAGIGLLDVLPRRATKLHAVEFLQKALEIPLSGTLFAGDSGNDLPVLASPIPSVLVANAMPSVTTEAVAAAESAGNRHALYLAKGDFLDMNGNYSAGILEGVAHFHPDLVPLFTERLGAQALPAHKEPGANE
jgi:HAD superfamily hydrolase (TIGR01484 family)